MDSLEDVDIDSLKISHIQAEHDAMQAVLGHIEQDANVLCQVRSFILKRAEIEAEYAKKLENLSKEYKIRPSKSGSIREYTGVAVRTAAESSFCTNQGSQGTNHILADMEGVTMSPHYRPSDYAIVTLVKENNHQSRSRYAFSLKLAQVAHEIDPSLIKRYGTHLKIANEHGYVLLSENNKVFSNIEPSKQLYKETWQDALKAKKRFDSIRTKLSPESSSYQRANLEHISAQRACQKARNDYYLALASANELAKSFYTRFLPKFFELSANTYIKTLSKFFKCYDSASSECYRQSFESLTLVNSVSEYLSPASEYEWLLSVKKSIPPMPLLFNFIPATDDTVQQITCDQVTGPQFASMLQYFVKKRDKAIQQIEKYEKNISNIEQSLEAFSMKPSLGSLKKAFLRSSHFQYRTFILEAFVAQAQVQIDLLVEAGIQPLIPVMSWNKETHRVLSTYVSMHKVDLSLQAGDLVTFVNPDVINGWTKVSHVITGKIGYIPLCILEGADSSHVLRVKAIYDYEATCQGELSIRVGDIIDVTSLDTGSSSWWEGVDQQKSGQFPRAFIAPLLEQSQSQSQSQSQDSATTIPTQPVTLASPPISPPVSPGPSNPSVVINASTSSIEWAESDVKQPVLKSSIARSPSPLSLSSSVPPPPPLKASSPLPPPPQKTSPLPPPPSLKASPPPPPPPPPPSGGPPPPPPPLPGLKSKQSVKALSDYNAQGPKELSFKKGQEITIVDESGDKYVGVLGGKQGEFPKALAEKKGAKI